MKKYTFCETSNDYTRLSGTVYIGSAQEVRAVYKACERAYYGLKSDIAPLYDTPTMCDSRTYGLVFEVKDRFNNVSFHVENAETVLRLIAKGLYKPA